MHHKWFYQDALLLDIEIQLVDVSKSTTMVAHMHMHACERVDTGVCLRVNAHAYVCMRVHVRMRECVYACTPVAACLRA